MKHALIYSWSDRHKTKVLYHEWRLHLIFLVPPECGCYFYFITIFTGQHGDRIVNVIWYLVWLLLFHLFIDFMGSSDDLRNECDLVVITLWILVRKDFWVLLVFLIKVVMAFLTYYYIINVFMKPKLITTLSINENTYMYLKHCT